MPPLREAMSPPGGTGTRAAPNAGHPANAGTDIRHRVSTVTGRGGVPVGGSRRRVKTTDSADFAIAATRTTTGQGAWLVAIAAARHDSDSSPGSFARDPALNSQRRAATAPTAATAHVSPGVMNGDLTALRID